MEDNKKYFIAVCGELYSDIIAVIVKAENREEALQKIGSKYGDLDWMMKEPRKMKTLVIQDIDEDIMEIRTSKISLPI